jgi:dTDP-4-dehydrorhamnose 3,5-epimerase
VDCDNSCTPSCRARKERRRFTFIIITNTRLKDAFIIELERHLDQRGFFARTFCEREFESHGLNPKLVQCSISFNTRKGTLRGLHYQAVPHAEAKLVRCTKGAIYDVVVDLRPHSSTFKEWIAVVLTGEKRNMVYVPEGCAHGFLTLEDKSEVFYQMSQFYDAESSRGVRWDDPAFQITWPGKVQVISERDRTYPNIG